MIEQNLPDHEYHARPEIGSTTAVLGVDNEPLLIDALDGIYTVEDKPCFIAGRLMHMAVLEPDRFKNLVVTDGPINDKTGKPFGRDTIKFKTWQEENPELTVVDEWIYTSLNRMPKEVKNILEKGESEVSVFFDKYKCRPDFWRREDKIFYDLKSIRTGGGSMERAIDRAISTRKYWFTTAWYRKVIELATGEKHECKLIFVEKELPHRWRVVDLDFDFLTIGDDEVLKIMNKIESNSLATDEYVFYQASAPFYLTEEEGAE